jgi:hypothetical protein
MQGRHDTLRLLGPAMAGSGCPTGAQVRRISWVFEGKAALGADGASSSPFPAGHHSPLYEAPKGGAPFSCPSQ